MKNVARLECVVIPFSMHSRPHAYTPHSHHHHHIIIVALFIPRCCMCFAAVFVSINGWRIHPNVPYAGPGCVIKLLFFFPSIAIPYLSLAWFSFASTIVFGSRVFCAGFFSCSTASTATALLHVIHLKLNGTSIIDIVVIITIIIAKSTNSNSSVSSSG